MRSQLLAARLAFAALVLAVLAAASAVVGVRSGTFPYETGIRIMAPATALGLVALAGALVWLRGAIASNTGTGKRLGLAALLGSLAFLYPPLSTLYYGATMPPLHDAATDPDDPPQFVALAKLRRPEMNSPVFDPQAKIRYQGEEVTVSFALHAYKNNLLTKPQFKLMPGSASPVKTLFWRCFEAAKQLGWTIVDYNEKEGRIEATAQSLWFGQVSDIVIRARAAGGIGARPDIRAESRTLARDNGFNIFLLKAFRQKLE
ncbi:MAG TPA: DUF1499 domain-containing protein [Rhizomicrobium sp.]